MQETKPLLKANVSVDAPQNSVRTWFLTLGRYPKRYSFDSHQGFVFTHGTFGEIGSRFYTRERFFGLTLKLQFEITEVQDAHFNLDCLPPYAGAWCRFSLDPETTNRTLLTLEAGTQNRLHTLFLKLPVLKNAIQNQIDAEVQHIKASIEHTFLKGDL